VILAVNGEKTTSQNRLLPQVWSLGTPASTSPLTVYHEGVTFDVTLTSTDRARAA